MSVLLAELRRTEIQFLSEQLGGQSSVAALLNVNRSSISRWLKSGQPDRDNQIRITAIELIIQCLHKIFDPDTAKKWLQGINAHLGNQRPIDLIRCGRISEVLVAIEQTDLGSYS